MTKTLLDAMFVHHCCRDTSFHPKGALIYFSRCSNMYKEAMVCEAMRAGPVVSHLKIRVEELLLEWPEHPGLIQVRLCNECYVVVNSLYRESISQATLNMWYIAPEVWYHSCC